MISEHKEEWQSCIGNVKRKPMKMDNIYFINYERIVLNTWLCFSLVLFLATSYDGLMHVGILRKYC